MIEWLREQSTEMEAQLVELGWRLGDCVTPSDFINWLEATGATLWVSVEAAKTALVLCKEGE